MALVRSGASRTLSYLGIVAALGSAMVIAGLLVAIPDAAESEAALDSQVEAVDVPVPTSLSVASTPVSPGPTSFATQIPAELLVPPQSVAPALVSPSAALPQNPPVPMAPARSDVTGSTPAPAVAPTPERPRQARPADQHRVESASARIARIKAALKLTPAQERYWPPVEAALRDIVAQIDRDPGPARGLQPSRRSNAPATIDPARVQRLTSAAIPLLMTFDEEQKREVRRLARAMGLENVASAI